MSLDARSRTFSLRPKSLPAPIRSAPRRQRRWLLDSAWSPRLAAAGSAFLVAFAADVATGRRLSHVLGSAAILVSALAVLPALRRLAVPIAAWVAVWVGFNVLRAIGDEMPWASATRTIVPNVEAGLLGASPSVLLQDALYKPGSVGVHDAVAIAVHLSFFVVPHMLAAILLITSSDCFHRYLTAMMALLLLGAATFIVMPTSPPWLAEASVVRIAEVALTEDGMARGGLNGAAPVSAHLAFELNPHAAMPSIHLGATILIAAMAISARRWRALGTAYAAAMGLSLIYLGEHHLFDVIAGAGLSLASWRLARRWAPALMPASGQEH